MVGDSSSPSTPSGALRRCNLSFSLMFSDGTDGTPPADVAAAGEAPSAAAAVPFSVAAASEPSSPSSQREGPSQTPWAPTQIPPARHPPARGRGGLEGGGSIVGGSSGISIPGAAGGGDESALDASLHLLAAARQERWANAGAARFV